MAVILFILSLLSFLWGCLVLIGAQSAIHEIEAFVLFLISAVLLSGFAIVNAIKSLRRND